MPRPRFFELQDMAAIRPKIDGVYYDELPVALEKGAKKYLEGRHNALEKSRAEKVITFARQISNVNDQGASFLVLAKAVIHNPENAFFPLSDYIRDAMMKYHAFDSVRFKEEYGASYVLQMKSTFGAAASPSFADQVAAETLIEKALSQIVREQRLDVEKIKQQIREIQQTLNNRQKTVVEYASPRSLVSASGPRKAWG